MRIYDYCQILLYIDATTLFLQEGGASVHAYVLDVFGQCFSQRTPSLLTEGMKNSEKSNISHKARRTNYRATGAANMSLQTTPTASEKPPHKILFYIQVFKANERECSLGYFAAEAPLWLHMEANIFQLVPGSHAIVVKKREWGTSDATSDL